MIKNQTLSIIALGCILNMTIQPAFMFNLNPNAPMAHSHIDSQSAPTVQTTQLVQNTLYTAGDDSEAKLALITEGIDQGKPLFVVNCATMKPKYKDFRTLADAQKFALEFLQQTTQAQLQQEALRQQQAARDYANSVRSNKYLTGGQGRRRNHKYQNS